jgi:choline-sulfatase
MQQPNILILMVDQLNGTFFPDGPAAFLHAPNLKRLAARSARFNANYCASPLCAPSRAAFMSGQLPSRTGVYDNAAEFPSSVPTFAHHLRRLGYRTVLSGKMHFVGPDQLHGFEERLTTDIYPADFGWTPDWTKPDERIDWWYHNLSSVTGAGVAEITNQLEYDDEVAHLARQRLFDFARKGDGRAFCLTVSFTHPHDPYVMRRKYWIFTTAWTSRCRAWRSPITSRIRIRVAFSSPATRRGSRSPSITSAPPAALTSPLSAISTKSGRAPGDAGDLRLRRRHGVVFTSDHGDMLGERGLWFKMNFSRVRRGCR